MNDWKPKIAFLSETHVCADVDLCELDIEGYRIVQCVTNNPRTGGVMALVRGDVKFKIKCIQCVENYVWLLSLEHFVSNIKYLFTVLYHPPQKENVKFVNFMENYFNEISVFDGLNVILGDFNYDLSKYSFYGEKIILSAFCNGLSQVVNSPTRITNTSKTLIDYIITNNKNIPFKVHLTPKISDHCIISVLLERVNKEESSISIKIRNNKNYDVNYLQNHLFSIEWNNSVNDVNILAQSFVSSIENILNIMCPIKNYFYKNKYENKKWITAEILSRMNYRDILYVRAIHLEDENVWNEYKLVRNNVVNMIRLEKDNYFKQMIDNNKNNSRIMWKNLKMLLPEKNHPVPSEVNFNGQIISDDLCIANSFNKYFISSICDIVSTIHKFPLNGVPVVLSFVNNEFSVFQKVTMSEMKKVIKDLKTVSGGKSGINKKVLSDVCDLCGNRLLDILNVSLSSGVFPEYWKKSVVVPVPKVPNTKESHQFRPINTVEIYEKVLELLVKKQLLNHCNINNILVPNQSGFRLNHSCETVIINICDTFVKCIDKGSFILAVFLDLKRAFETVNRNILLNKLYNYGLRNTVFNWFKSYLSNRSQTVKFKDVTSDSLNVDYGVPQGTVLGPLLFLMYVNDIVNSVKYCQMELFADDTMIYISGTDLKQMEVKLNSDLNTLFIWLCNNNLCINTEKTKYCLFGKKQKLNSVDTRNLNIEINNVKIVHVDQIKYLGVIFDSSLTFQPHAEYIMRKFSKKINFISRAGKNLSVHTKLLLYNSIAAPHLEFCSTILYNLPHFLINKFQIIQNKALRTILNCNIYTPIATMLNVLCIMSVRQKIIFNVYLFIFKIKNKMLPTYLCNKIQIFKELHSYETRNCFDFIITDRCNSSQMLNSILYKGLLDFNKLPCDIKNCDNIQTFKHLLRIHVLSVY